MSRRFLAILWLGAVIPGCSRSAPGNSTSRGPELPQPVPVLQKTAYPETVTGSFVSLVDFEDVPEGPSGHRQVRLFHVSPGDGGRREFAVNITRTGTGAMSVTLPAGSELAFAVEELRNFEGYALLLAAVYVEYPRDDLRVTLVSGRGSWRSHRVLVTPGWNTVLIDIRRLRAADGFDVKNVREIRIGFAEAEGDVSFYLDDILLIDNRRRIEPAPLGMEVLKEGLDYEIRLPRDGRVVRLVQGADGLWRLGPRAVVLQLVGPAGPASGGGEQLELMGPRRVGQLEVVESNRVRFRAVGTWYFPSSAGEWASLAVRHIRWEYTFYLDGRVIVHVGLNNAGGEEIRSVVIELPRPGAWAGAGVSDRLRVDDPPGSVGAWSCLPEAPQMQKDLLQANYLRSGDVRVDLGTGEWFSPFDADRDRFDESQGCYYLKADRGHCRFTILPPAEGLLSPVVRVAGNWAGEVSVNSQGLAVRDVVRLDDGSVLFVLRGWLRDSTAVEVIGHPALTEGVR